MWLVVSALLAADAGARMARLGYSNPDDAMAVQHLWNALQGRPLYDSLESFEPPYERNHLGSHAAVLDLIEVPVYALTRSLPAVVLLRALLAMAGIFPLFLLAERRLGGAGMALAVALIALAHPLLLANSVRLGTYFTYAPALLLLALERLDARAWRGSAVAFALAFASREEVALPVAAFLFATAAVDRERRRFALAVGAAGLLWLVLYLKGIQGPVFGGGGHLGRYAHLGGSLAAIALSPLLRPAAFWGHLLAGGALALALALVAPFLPPALLAPRHLLAAAAPWTLVALSAYEGDRVLGRYLVPALPFLLAAVPEGLAALRERARPRLGWDPTLSLVAVAAGLTLLVWQVDAGPLAHYRRVRPLDPSAVAELERLTPEHPQIRAALARVPPDAVVSSTVTTQLFLAERRFLHCFPARAQEADVVVVDPRRGVPHWPPRSDAAIRAALERSKVGAARVEQVGPIVIVWRR